MKFSKLKGLALGAMLGAIGLLPTGAHAGITATAGDVILGFRASGGTGATVNYTVKLGQASQFTGATGSFAVTGLGSIATDLAAIYGAGWHTRSDLFYGIIGATDSFAAVGGDPAKTLYASKVRPSAVSVATPWNRASDTAQGTATSKVNGLRSGLASGTSSTNSTVAVTHATGDLNSWSSYLGGGASYGLYNPTIEAVPASSVDLFKMTPGSGSGTHLGSFSLQSDGSVLFVTATEYSDFVGNTGVFAAVGSFSVSPAVQAVASGSTSATVTVSRTGGLAASSVLISTSPGTATAPANFTAISGQSVSFGLGQTSTTVTITLSGTVVTTTKAFNATISSPSVGGTLGSPTTASIRIRSSTPDTTAPVVAITAPALNATVKEPTTPTGTVKIEGTLNGTTGDPSIDTVTVSINGGAAIPAVISTDKKKWAVTFTGATAANAALAFGNNSVVATATDLDVNVGTSAARPFFYEVLRPLTVTINPLASGTVSFSPTLSAGKAAVGRTYTVLAKPNTGFFFDSWSGKPTGSTATTSFVFDTGDTVVANFVATPFTSTVIGLYNGSIEGSTVGTDTQANSGLFTASVTLNTGAFTGKLLLDGVTSPVAGVFNNVTKEFSSAVATNGFTYALTLDLASPVKKITGTVTLRKRGADVAVLNINAPQGYSKTTLPSGTDAGTYNVAFGVPTAPVALLADEYPHGNGYGILTVSATDGSAKVVGILADGTAYASAAVLCRDGTVPLYASFASRIGALAGKLTLDAVPADSDVTGSSISWFRSENKGQYYPWGYDTGLTVSAVGAKQSSSTQASLALTAAPSVDFSGGPIASAVNKVLAASGTGFASADKIAKISFTAAGLMSGEYSPSGLTSKHVIKGIIVGKGGSGEAYGYVLSPLPAHTDGSGQGGLVTINP